MCNSSFSKVEARPSFPEIEAQVLKRWKREKTFEASLEKTKDGKEFIFYDGPPFPTGTPHHGTIFVSILKDVIPRYRTMQGDFVPRTWGWDCHGLPIETLAEKNLGITEKGQIEKDIGVKAFNDECRRIVSEFNEAWRDYIDKLGRWVDFDHPYRTLDRSFMESVIWSFAECYRKDLIYKDYRVTPYCYRCETPLSISDTRLDDATRPRQDRTIVVKIRINELEDTYFLAWTTTPWTLPSNLALAVGLDIKYVCVKVADAKYILAASRLGTYQKELGKQPEILEELSGSELIAKAFSYTPLFPYFADQNPNGFKLIPADFVSTDDGTGIVHLAPAFGEDDYWTCREHKIAVQAPVDARGVFTETVSDFAGRNVHEANSDIIRFLKDQGMVLSEKTMEHNYPHCWRCRTPLIYKAVDAWYFSVDSIKEQMLENNEEVFWAPESIKHGRFGKWLENARDWNISRNRYWATPIPVWECDGCDSKTVPGSLEELEAYAGHPLEDLHKEYLDPITFSCKDCSGTKRRVPEVLDGWYESGSMPYGQFHYPFENAEHFRSHFPCDFIVEYTGQIRGWFYYLHVLSTALFNRPAFKNCLVHGTLLAADGKKISKSQSNYTDPMDLIDRFGADALRAYLLSSNAVHMADLTFRDDGVEGMLRSLHLPLWNALVFFSTYAETDSINRADLNLKDCLNDLQEIDRYILSESELLLAGVSEKLESYALHEAVRLLPVFLDTLNNWYIRRIRKRVWSEDKEDKDKLAVYAVLYRILNRFAQTLAPFCPFLAEAVWERLGNLESVHLSSWPECECSLIDHALSEKIALTRSIISAALAIRVREGIRVRQPLRTLKVAVSIDCDISDQLDAIKEELNVKELIILENEGEIADRIGKANARELGPRFGKDTQIIVNEAKLGNFKVLENGKVDVAGFTLEPELLEIVYVGKEGLAVESAKGAVVALDLQLTDELQAEGYARDLVRHIQDLRKEADLEVSDRIELAVVGADSLVEQFRSYICSETLATSVTIVELSSPKAEQELELGALKVKIAFRVAD